VRDALIDSRSGSEQKYEKDGYAIKWSFVNDLELIFVVAYQRILQLTYVDDLIAALKALFVKLYEPFLRTFVASLHAAAAGTVSVETVVWDFTSALSGWDKYFDQVLKKFEDRAAQVRYTVFMRCRTYLTTRMVHRSAVHVRAKLRRHRQC